MLKQILNIILIVFTLITTPKLKGQELTFQQNDGAYSEAKELNQKQMVIKVFGI